jgi:hypothetical protein
MHILPSSSKISLATWLTSNEMDHVVLIIELRPCSIALKGGRSAFLERTCTCRP